MTDSIKYLLDTNSFKTPYRTYYSFDFNSPFWDFLIHNAENNKIFSIDKVYKELIKGEDALKKWVIEKFKKYFLSSESPEILFEYANIINWAQI